MLVRFSWTAGVLLLGCASGTAVTDELREGADSAVLPWAVRDTSVGRPPAPEPGAASNDDDLTHLLDTGIADSSDSGQVVPAADDDSGPPGAAPGPPRVTCDDGLQNGRETATDCGGFCEPCGPGLGCRFDTDCLDQQCVNERCALPTCVDDSHNGLETATDCGGDCPPCISGVTCLVSQDCISQLCINGRCATPSCEDQVHNGLETDVDCGGDCPGCAPGSACSSDTDCVDPDCMNGLCQAPSCEDGRLNGTEEGVDCGGICDGCQTRQLGCQAIDDRWPAAWVQIEEAVLAATNRARSAARRCGQHGHFEAAPPLARNDLLRCAARRHSSDMADRDFFSHTSPEMSTPADRIREAGYRFEVYAENILRKTGRVQNSANHGRQVVNTWLRSPGHCKNIMDPNLTELGPGYFGRIVGRFRNFHTQVLGRPD